MIKMRVTALLGTIYLGFLACSSQPENPLQFDRLIGSNPDSLIARLGAPKQHKEESVDGFGFMRWLDIGGVHVLVVIREGKGEYVSYQFRTMEPFDEQRALEMIGIGKVSASFDTIPRSRAKRWMPFGEYERLTINSDTRLVSVGKYPSPSIAEQE